MTCPRRYHVISPPVLTGYSSQKATALWRQWLPCHLRREPAHPPYSNAGSTCHRDNVRPREESLEKCPFPRKRRNRWRRRVERVVESQCRIGRTDLRRRERYRRRTRTRARWWKRSRKEDNEEAEGTRSAVTLAATLATLKQPPHRYCRAVGQAVAFTTELE